jgi:hypothetical protein
VGQGLYKVVLPNPEPGTWTIQLGNTSTWAPFARRNTELASDEDAEYVITVRALGASVRPAGSFASSGGLELRNIGSAIRQPAIAMSSGSLRSHHASFLSTGLPNVIDVAVPEDAATLRLQVRSDEPDDGVELFLYDCTSGECFSYDIAFPAARTHTLVVRKPKAGRWVAAINPAPFAPAKGGFTLDEVITTGDQKLYTSGAPRPPGARWTQVVEVTNIRAADPGRTGILFFELFDAAAERDEAQHPWDPRKDLPDLHRLRVRPVSLGSAIYRR